MLANQPRLVFGDDGSAAADVVWLWINNHAWPGWRISIVTAQRPTELGSPLAAERTSLHPWEPPVPRRLFSDAEVTSIEHLTAEADPRLVLDSVKDAALLAIGPRGKGILKHLHVGSTAEWLLSAHRPLAPLVIVRSARPTRHVLLCVDGSAHALAAARALARLPWIGRCRVTVLGVRDRTADAERGAKEAIEVLGESGADLQPLLMDAIPGTVTFEVRPVILDVIAQESPDLVAVGTRGLGGVQRLVLGSTASAVAHFASCSTLVVPSRDSAAP